MNSGTTLEEAGHRWAISRGRYGEVAAKPLDRGLHLEFTLAWRPTARDADERILETK